MPDPIATYLGHLAALLGPSLPDRQRLLAEVEDHLRSAVEAAAADGGDAERAMREAIRRFGTPAEVARALEAALFEPLVFDARNGLPAAALDELGRARRIALSGKSAPCLAVLGYWVPVGPRERFGAIVLRMRHHRCSLPAAEQPVVHAPVGDGSWWHTQLLPRLRPGIQLHVEVWAGETRIWYGPLEAAAGPRGAFRYVAFRSHDHASGMPLERLIVC